MLQELHIANLALIERSEMEFAPGFNVITGETGAGKSLLLGAVALLFGGRAEKGVIRTGAARCEVAGRVKISGAALPAVETLLESAGLEMEPEGILRIRRVVTENASRFYLNDTPVGAQLIRRIAEFIVDIHNADEHGALTRRGEQLLMLDRYAGALNLRAECAALCARRSALSEEKARFAAGRPSEVEAEHLERILQEIESVDPLPDEDKTLSARHALAANAQEIIALSNGLSTLLTDGENSIRDQLAAAYRELQNLRKLDETGGGALVEACDLLMESLDDLSGRIAEIGGKVELDESAFAELEARLSALHSLKRRHGPTLEQVFATAERARERLADYRAGDARLSEFSAREAALEQELRTLCRVLSEKRRSAAESFTAEARHVLASLGFVKAVLEAEWSPAEPGAAGAEQLELLFSANLGEAPQPLRKIASSGELSRLMLALKTVLADADSIPVVVFDEIDMNIGGETANVVGALLRRLGERRQILCISHLAQVAARGEKHFLASKRAVDHRVISEAVVLDGASHLDELARMLGGGPAALAHARAMAEAAQ